jgi:esterase/lipase
LSLAEKAAQKRLGKKILTMSGNFSCATHKKLLTSRFYYIQYAKHAAMQQYNMAYRHLSPDPAVEQFL